MHKFGSWQNRNIALLTLYLYNHWIVQNIGHTNFGTFELRTFFKVEFSSCFYVLAMGGVNRPILLAWYILDKCFVSIDNHRQQVVIIHGYDIRDSYIFLKRMIFTYIDVSWFSTICRLSSNWSPRSRTNRQRTHGYISMRFVSFVQYNVYSISTTNLTRTK